MRLGAIIVIIFLADGISTNYLRPQKHPCDRRCLKYDRRSCVYRWTAHLWSTLGRFCGDCPKKKEDCFKFGCVTATGHKRSIKIVNGQMPGPTIAVCENDVVTVHVETALMESDTLAIHWHGLHVRETPHMDGVPFITQCPIYGQSKFRYRFVAYPAGTHFWHSHAGLQRADGLAGPLIVRKFQDPLQKFYDVDSTRHTMLIQDWFHVSAFEGFAREHIDFFDLKLGMGNLGSRETAAEKGKEKEAKEQKASKKAAEAETGRLSRLKEHVHSLESFLMALEKKLKREAYFERKEPHFQEKITIENRVAFLKQLEREEPPSGPKIALDGGHSGTGEKQRAGRNDSQSGKGKKESETGGHNEPKILLINGRNAGTNKNISMPLAVFKVSPHRRHRFRFISNGIQTCPFEIYVEKHVMNVIAGDGQPIKPIPTDRLLLQGGERFDVVIEANQPVGNYWIRVRSYFDCEGVFGYAILSYVGAKANPFTPPPKEPFPMRPKPRLFNILGGRNDTRRIFFSQAEALFPGRKTFAHIRRYVPFGFTAINNKTLKNPFLQPAHIRTINHKDFVPQIWDRTFQVPSAPMLTQFHDIANSEFCDQPPAIHCPHTELCRCLARIVVPKNSVVDLVLFDHAAHFELSHPFHLHGYLFQVLESGVFNKSVTLSDVKARLSTARLNSLSQTAPYKDTVGVPARGYVVLRVFADNPGVWFFHCHVDFHSENGMAFVLQVGGPHQWVKPPPHFQRCGNFP